MSHSTAHSSTSHSTDVMYSPLPGSAASSQHILTITPNIPTPDDTLHIRHLKQIAVKSYNERLKSQTSISSRTSGLTQKRVSKASLCSSTGARSVSSDSSAPSISSRTTHSMFCGGASDSDLSLGGKEPFLYRDSTWVWLCCWGVAGFGMFWCIQAIFIEELMEITGVSLQVMGYLCTVIRVGKVVGHVCFVPLTAIYPDNHASILVLSIFTYALLVVSVPYITNPILLAVNWFIIGTFYGIADSTSVLIIQLLGGTHREKQMFNNSIYGIYSLATFITSLFVQLIKEHESSSKTRLILSFSSTSVVTLAVAGVLVTMVYFRHHHNISTETGATVQVPAHFKGFRRYYLSFTLLSISAFLSVFLTSTMWVFGLLYVRNARANLTTHQADICLEVFYGTLMGMRIGSVLLVKYYKNSTVIMAGCNGLLAVTALCTVLLQDTVYEGLLFSMIFFGLGIGLFHQSLLNWLTDHIIITPKTSLPFFLSSSSGVVFAPTIVPHIAANEQGEVLPDRFIWLTFGLTISIIISTSLLLVVESLKQEELSDDVIDIEIMPSILYSYAASRASNRSRDPDRASTRSGTPTERREEGAAGTPWSRLSKLSTYTQTLDPVLSFVSSIN